MFLLKYVYSDAPESPVKNVVNDENRRKNYDRELVQVSWLDILQSQFNFALLGAELLSDLINVGAVDHSHPPALLTENERFNYLF